MVKEYTCEKCGKVFSQKGHFMNHQKRKRPCNPIENKVIEEKVQEKLQELSKNGEIEIKNWTFTIKIVITKICYLDVNYKCRRNNCEAYEQLNQDGDC